MILEIVMPAKKLNHNLFAEGGVCFLLWMQIFNEQDCWIEMISRIILSDTFLLKLNLGLMQTGGGFILPDYFYHTKDEIIRLHSYLVHREN